MSAFTDLFLRGIAWGALWHFSVYLIDATIKNRTWSDVAGKTIGVIITYPFVEAAICRAAVLDGADVATVQRLRVWVFMGYFCGYLAGGVGKVVGTALDLELKDERVGELVMRLRGFYKI